MNTRKNELSPSEIERLLYESNQFVDGLFPQSETDVSEMEAMFGSTPSGNLQHPFRKIDRYDFAMPGVHGEGDASADSDFKDALGGLGVQVADGGLTSFVEDFAENPIVHTGIGRVDALDFVQIHITSNRTSRLLPSA